MWKVKSYFNKNVFLKTTANTIVVMFVLLFFALCIFWINPADKLDDVLVTNYECEYGTTLLYDGIEAKQEINVDNFFNKIELVLGNNNVYGMLGDALIHVELLNEDGIVDAWCFDRDDLKEITKKSFVTKDVLPPGRYSIEVLTEGSTEKNPIVIYNSNSENNDEDEGMLGLNVSGKNMGNNVIIKVSRSFNNYFMYLAVTLWLLTFAVWCFNKSENIERIAFLLILGFGLCYIILLTPFSTPDEPSHYHAAYKISNIILGNDLNYIEPEYCYSYNRYTAHLNSAKSYIKVLKEISDRNNVYSGDVEVWDIVNIKIMPLPYVAAAILLAIGRTAGIDFLFVYYGGRIVNLVLFTIICCYAIKITPILKKSLMFFLLSPVILQEASSYSYDWLIVSSSILFISLVLRCAYIKERVEAIDYVMIAVCILGFLPYKPVYLPLLLLFILVPRDKYIVTINKHAIIGGGIVCTIVIGFFLRRAGDLITSVNLNRYNIVYFFNRPFDNIKMIVRSIYEGWWNQVVSLFGSTLSGFCIEIPTFVCVTFLFMVLVISSYDDGVRIIFRKKQLLLLGVIIVMIVAMINGTFYLVTERKEEMIWGIQGRYFAPIVYPFLMIMRERRARGNVNLRACIIIVFILQLCVINTISSSVL